MNSTLMCLRPGLILINSARANKKIPKMFKKWDKIWFEDVAPTSERIKISNKVRKSNKQKNKRFRF